MVLLSRFRHYDSPNLLTRRRLLIITLVRMFILSIGKNGFILAEHEKRIVSHLVLELFDSVVDLAINEELKGFKLDLDLVNFSL